MSELTRLARILHARSFAIITIKPPIDPVAYCDESIVTGEVLVIAGYMGPLAQWESLDSAWKYQCHHPNPRKEGRRYSPIREFKAADCENRTKIFRHWNNPADRKACAAAFAQIVSQSNLLGVATVVDLKAYRELVPSIKRLRHPGYWPAYFLAFQHQLEAMAKAANRAVGLPTTEQIAFIFDEQTEYQGRALGLWQSLRQSDHSGDMNWIDRLGSITFDKSEKHPGLQAADQLAYEVQRNIREVVWAEVPMDERSHFRTLRRQKQLNLSYIDKDGLDLYMDVIKAQWLLSIAAEDRARLDEAELDFLPPSLRAQVLKEREDMQLSPDT